MEIAPRDSLSNEPWQIRFSVKTNSFADKFYKVRTSVTSWVDSNFTRSLRYVKSQQEGKTKKEIDVTYDYSKKKLFTSKTNNLLDYCPWLVMFTIL